MKPDKLDIADIEVTEDTILNWGVEHRGEKLKDIPKSYLYWCFNHSDILDKQCPAIYDFLEDYLEDYDPEVDAYEDDYLDENDYHGD